MKRIIANSASVVPMTLKTAVTLKLKLLGGDLEDQSWGNCTPAPLIMSCTKYGTTKPMTKPKIKSVIAVFMAAGSLGVQPDFVLAINAFINTVPNCNTRPPKGSRASIAKGP